MTRRFKLDQALLIWIVSVWHSHGEAQLTSFPSCSDILPFYATFFLLVRIFGSHDVRACCVATVKSRLYSLGLHHNLVRNFIT